MKNLGLIVLPQLSKEDLWNKKQDGINLQKAWKEYNDYLTNTANLTAKRGMLEEQLSELQTRQAGQRDYQSQISPEIEDVKKEINDLNELLQELGQIKTEGKRLYFELKGLDSKKVCPSCGQELKNQEHLDKHKKELSDKIQELLNQQTEQYQKFLNKYPGISKDEIDTGCKTILGDLSKRQTELMVEVNTINDLTKRVEQTQSQLGV